MSINLWTAGNSIHLWRPSLSDMVILTPKKEASLNKYYLDMIFIFNEISWFTLIHQEFTWMKNIKEWLGHTYNGCVRRAKDRTSWRSMIADLLLVDGTWWWWWVWEPFKQHLSLYVTLFGEICCLPSNFAKTELICCPQNPYYFT